MVEEYAVETALSVCCSSEQVPAAWAHLHGNTHLLVLHRADVAFQTAHPAGLNLPATSRVHSSLRGSSSAATSSSSHREQDQKPSSSDRQFRWEVPTHAQRPMDSANSQRCPQLISDGRAGGNGLEQPFPPLPICVKLHQVTLECHCPHNHSPRHRHIRTHHSCTD